MFGIHKFFLGYTREGVVMLLITLLTIFILAWIPAVIGIAEGIIYLTMTDQEFDAIYVQNRKHWF
ncbi:MAG: NINE protein [Candidatus Delongbacteria bacterium]|nr:NINE protein [Candidatus Delongbacteria bacterium]